MAEDKKKDEHKNQEDMHEGIPSDTYKSSDILQTCGSEDDPLNLIGKEVVEGHYIITEYIKEGGFSYVYKGEHTLLEEIYIFKILKSIYPQKDADTREKTKKHALKEAKKIKKLDHKNIAEFKDVVRIHGLFCLLEEYIDGKTLNDSLNDREMEKWYRKEENAIFIFKQILEGLSYCHQRGIIHKDLTLNNILITKDKEIKIIDFGLSIQSASKTIELLQSQSNKLITTKSSQFSTGNLHAGTFPYLSPEQIDYIERLNDGKGGNNTEKTDKESLKTLFNEQIDIWSFGVIAYILVTGRQPFDGTSQEQLFNHIKHDYPIPPKNINPLISEQMNKLIMKCLEKDKTKRYKTAEEILEGLKKVEERLKNPHSSTIDSRQSKTIEDKKLEQLSQTEEEKVKTQEKEETDWQEALELNTMERYLRFINTYPESEFVEIAKEKISKLIIQENQDWKDT